MEPPYDAFVYIVGHPEVYKTTVSLDIQSGLLFLCVFTEWSIASSL